MMNTMVWLAVMIILIIIEIVTVGLATIWFAIGALVAIIVSMLGGGIILQLTVFLVVSFGMLILTRPLAVKYINNSRTRTNYEGIIGKVVRITQDVDNIADQGAAGQTWGAALYHSQNILSSRGIAWETDRLNSSDRTAEHCQFRSSHREGEFCPSPQNRFFAASAACA